MIALVTGGSGCGKSTWAEKFVQALGAADATAHQASSAVFPPPAVLPLLEMRSGIFAQTRLAENENPTESPRLGPCPRPPGGRKFYVATLRVVDGECRARVARHRLSREGLGFETIERAADIGGAPIEPGGTALVECLPTLLANEMFGGDPERVLPGLKRLMDACRHLVVVTNDVFSDGLTYDPQTTAYIRKLAEINRAVAERADLVVEVVFSIPAVLKGAIPCGALKICFASFQREGGPARA